MIDKAKKEWEKWQKKFRKDRSRKKDIVKDDSVYIKE